MLHNIHMHIGIHTLMRAFIPACILTYLHNFYMHILAYVHVFALQGSLTKIGMRGDLFLGGYSNLTAVGRRTGMSWGFVGCISKLVVNSKDYDMRRGAYVGDAIYGQDVG